MNLKAAVESEAAPIHSDSRSKTNHPQKVLTNREPQTSALGLEFSPDSRKIDFVRDTGME